MTGNPEFTRNLWLEIKFSRLVTLPALLAALFLMVGVPSGFGESLSTTALAAYMAIVFIWGNRLAANLVIQEVNNGTWDSQRMSAITPWAMTIGKLYGSTIYVWLGGMICLGVYWLAQVKIANNTELYQTTIIYLGCGLLSHIVSLIASLVAIRKRRAYGRMRVWLYQFIGLAAAAPVFAIGFGGVSASERFIDMSWYGISFPLFEFIVLAITIYVAWGIIGVYAMIRAELLLPNGQWYWLGFTAFTSMFLAGIGTPEMWGTAFRFGPVLGDPIWRAFAIGSYIVLFLALMIALTEPKGRFVVHLLKRYSAERRWGDYFNILPRSVPTLMIALVMGAVLSIWMLNNAVLSEHGNFAARVLSVFLFAARDIGFIMAMSLWIMSPRADMTSLVCLAISYTVVPVLLFAWGLQSFMPAFRPMMGEGVFQILTPISIEVIGVYLALASTIRSEIKS